MKNLAVVMIISHIIGYAEQTTKGDKNFVVKGNNNKISLSDQTTKGDKIVWKPVHTDLQIPHKSIFLTRTNLFEKLKDAFKSKNGITTVALVGVVGMGGVGKTTLARYWAKKQIEENKEITSFEFNCESKEAFFNALKQFSILLAQTQAQKSDLQNIENIKDETDREAKRISFIRDILKQSKGWILIYDNVDDMVDIETYLPKDSDMWGNGQVLITTRNAHLTLTQNVDKNAVVIIEELTKDEALTLFSRIRYSKEPEDLNDAEKQDGALALQRIPMFPLDISIAARYMEQYGILSVDYIKMLDAQDVSFLATQKELLKQVNEYPKTRYEIITLSLDKIITNDEGNLEKLLLISMIDSQNIPKEMLNELNDGSYKNGKTDNFILNMKRSSLLSVGKTTNNTPVLSLHRSTQEIAYAYIVSKYKLDKTSPIVRDIVQKMTTYVDNILNKEDREIIRILELHGNQILKCALLTEEEIIKSKGVLGCLIYFSGQIKRSQELLKNSIQFYEKSKKNNPYLLSRLYDYLGRSLRVLCHYDDAKKCFKKSIEYAKKSGCEDILIESKLSLAHIYYVTSEYLLAESQIDQIDVEKIKNNILKRTFYRYKHLIEREIGIYAGAIEYIEKTLSILEKNHIKDEKYALDTLSLALFKTEMGVYDDVLNIAKTAIDIYKLNDNKTFFYWKQNGYFASIARRVGSYSSSINTLQECKNFFEKNDPDNALDLGFIHAQIAKAYRSQGHIEKALEHIEKAKALYLNVFGAKNLRTEWIDMTLGQLLNDQEKYDDAVILFENCLNEHLKQLKPTHPKIGKIKAELGYAYLKKGDIAKGQKHIDEAFAVYENHYGKDHIRTAYVLRMKAECFAINNQLDKALELAQNALQIAETFKHPDVVLALESIARYQLKMNNAQGQQTQQKALQKSIDVFGSDSSHTKRIQKDLNTKR